MKNRTDANGKSAFDALKLAYVEPEGRTGKEALQLTTK